MQTFSPLNGVLPIFLTKSLLLCANVICKKQNFQVDCQLESLNQQTWWPFLPLQVSPFLTLKLLQETVEVKIGWRAWESLLKESSSKGQGIWGTFYIIYSLLVTWSFKKRFVFVVEDLNKKEADYCSGWACLLDVLTVSQVNSAINSNICSQVDSLGCRVETSTSQGLVVVLNWQLERIIISTSAMNNKVLEMSPYQYVEC